MEPIRHILKLRLNHQGLGTVELDGRPIRTAYISLESAPDEAPIVRLDVLVDELDIEVESERIEANDA